MAEHQHTKPLCKYGEKCYRKNSEHFSLYAHQSNSASDYGETETTSTKRQIESKAHKTSTTNKRIKRSAAVSCSSPFTSRELDPVAQAHLSEITRKYSFYLTYVHRGIDESFNTGSALTLHNIINGTADELLESIVVSMPLKFSYMYDIDWLVQQFRPELRSKPLMVVEGLKGESRIDLLESASQYSHIKIVKARMDIMYGVHHTKMIILRYTTGIRICITTANLVPMDWFQKTQAVWCSPLFPKGEGESKTNFKSDLVEYLNGYKLKSIDYWAEMIKQHNMSKCKVFLITSIPGRHVAAQKSSFGHLKLRKILSEHGPPSSTALWPLIGQFSSIGKLGNNASQWLCGEFSKSLATTKGQASATSSPPIKLVYPTVENVRKSLEGYMAGGSLPFTKAVYDTQTYINPYLHQWCSDTRGRSEASPHIKTYMKVSPDYKKVSYVLMTSANLSKAAWGALEKAESQLMIRSYELGVLFLPQMFDLEMFTADKDFGAETSFPLPFDLPLLPYSTSDEIWLCDKSYNKPDSLGESYRV